MSGKTAETFYKTNETDICFIEYLRHSEAKQIRVRKFFFFFLFFLLKFICWITSVEVIDVIIQNNKLHLLHSRWGDGYWHRLIPLDAIIAQYQCNYCSNVGWVVIASRRKRRTNNRKSDYRGGEQKNTRENWNKVDKKEIWNIIYQHYH